MESNVRDYFELAKKSRERVEREFIGYGDKVLLRGRILDKKRIIEKEFGTFFMDIGDNRYVKINIYDGLLKKHKYEVGDFIFGEYKIMIRKVKASGNYSVEFKLVNIITYQGGKRDGNERDK